MFESNELGEKLWDLTELFSKKMKIDEYKKYIIGFIFYKYLSEKLEFHVIKNLEDDPKNDFYDAWEVDEYKDDLEDDSIDELGYFLEPKYLFQSIVAKSRNGEFIIEDIENAFNQFQSFVRENEDEGDDFLNLFEDIDLTVSRLGESEEDKNKTISELILKLDSIDFKIDTDENVLKEAFEYLITEFDKKSAGKNLSKIHTPKQVCDVISKIVTLDKKHIKSVYDPTCGSASLLLSVAKEMNAKDGKIHDFYGQEINQTTYNLARMNMTLHNIPFNDFNIKSGDVLENPMHKDKKFEVIVSHPPSNEKWSADKKFLEDERFSAYGKLPHKSKSDYAFIQHMIYLLEDSGVMAVIYNKGILYRKGDSIFREYLIGNKNYLDSVIRLPENLFYGTSSEIVILIFKKFRSNEDILFINASNDFEKNLSQNILRPQDIDKIVNTYKNRDEIKNYSRNVSVEEVIENEYNLNIPRYIDCYGEIEDVDLQDISEELRILSDKLDEVDDRLKKYFDDLEIDAPIW